jgi:transcriptional regulator with XRE-family HTH domain
VATSDRHELGKRIRKARDDAKLSREKIAPMVGVSAATILRYETGRTDITFERLSRIAQVTNRSMSWFLTEEQAA